jgi:CRISPR system Cascade subunit CasD
MQCLILRFDAPLMAFGDVAVDEIRPTRQLPTLSMLTGLLGNALGLDHREAEALQRLQDRLRFAARLDQPGRVIVDYQTARLNKRDPLWTTRGTPGERAGGGTTWDGAGFGTVERHRHYLADAAVTLALTLEPAGETPDLGELAQALRRPERPLFLGRKGCPPATPLLLAGPLEHDSLVAALAATPPRRPVDGATEMAVEVDDLPREPPGRRVIEVADRRSWRSGLHQGTRRVRELLTGGDRA